MNLNHPSHTTSNTVDPVSLLSFVVNSLLGSDADFTIQPIVGPYSLILELKLRADDVGRLVGKNGKIAKAVRHVLQSIPNKNVLIDGKVEKFRKITLEIID